MLFPPERTPSVIGLKATTLVLLAGLPVVMVAAFLVTVVLVTAALVTVVLAAVTAVLVAVFRALIGTVEIEIELSAIFVLVTLSDSVVDGKDVDSDFVSDVDASDVIAS